MSANERQSGRIGRKTGQMLGLGGEIMQSWKKRPKSTNARKGIKTLPVAEAPALEVNGSPKSTNARKGIKTSTPHAGSARAVKVSKKHKCPQGH